MDVEELLTFKPVNTPKRPQDDEPGRSDDGPGEYERYRKMRRLDERPTQVRRREEQMAPPKFKEDADEEGRQKIKQIVDSLDEGGAGESDVLDENAMKRMVLLFEKRALKNQEMRIKFPDSPEKFMESEVELHTTLTELRALATVPELYPKLVELGAVPSMLELLAHENTDIAIAVVNLLQELTDIDTLTESQEGSEALVDALMAGQACALLVQNLDRLDESVPEEAEGVHNTLSIFENITEVRSQICNDAASQGLLSWLLKRLKAKMPFHANKLYTSEMLSILLQSNNENRQLLGDLEGIDILLQQLAYYKRHDPSSSEELEMMENLFDCLCSSLMLASNRDKFLKGEGLQLMNLMLREKKQSRNGSLKVLDHAMSGPDGKDNCNKFVDILGLRTIFPLFMKTPPRSKKRTISTEEHEEHVSSVIASMLRNCRGGQRTRLLTKFAENDHEKIDRLIELHFKYLEKMEKADLAIDEDVRKRRRDDSDDEEDEDTIYLKRLDAGLFTLQLIDYVILEICSSGQPSIKQRALQMLNLRGGSTKTIKQIMREYAGNLGELGDKEWRSQEQQHILNLVDKF
ncbi:beta-catenin-like protein 1 isoform X2 [Neocloeon triangulifer]|uniref:beta-catenin-like protein 1 isoform X2 n=1 Tax=Neocloeon triangulifer TaxID=2078957 RepID=UPI00286ECA86|nr:beta-catenin-like protein 1 isoform X2 [Neocloeon triangulifer]